MDLLNKILRTPVILGSTYYRNVLRGDPNGTVTLIFSSKEKYKLFD